MSAMIQDADKIVEAIVREVGSRIVLALPLGLGKANHIANAFYARALSDRSIHLTIFTALTLESPKASSLLEQRFLGPLVDRVFAGYPELAYAQPLRTGTLPPNIEVSEFFFLAGRWLSVPRAQQHYVSANYTHVARLLVERGVNVIGQLVAKKTLDGEPHYSLSCNTDLTLDLLKMRADGRTDFRLVGQVNSELPFMPGDGDLPASTFSHVLDSPTTDFPLFAPPNQPVSFTDYAAGLHIARLVPDGGTLQIGIGNEGDAVAQSLILRHRHNAAFREALDRLDPSQNRDAIHETAPFATGLYGLSEMFVPAFLDLIDAGVLTREVDGALLHAAFFLGPRAFYRSLREMAPALLARLQMTAVSFTNEMYGDEDAKRRGRVKARFINSAMMATVLGAVVSDGLADGQVVSGVGGQYNFASQAFALDDARSIIALKATRTAGAKTESNIRWNYGHETIPRHLRDVIVTEYGAADVRGKSDRDVIGAMLAIADSRFQPELLRQAKDAGKIEKTFALPAGTRENSPEKITAALSPLHERGLLPAFPFGTDFTALEQRLLPALEALKAASHSALNLAKFVVQGQPWRATNADETACLARLGLVTPATVSERLYGILVRAALRQTQALR